MSNRKNKRRLYKLWNQNSQYFRLTAEDRKWLDMAPVGREFGSPDYERLMKLDALPESIKSSLISQVQSMVTQSGNTESFDEEIWLARWLFEPLSALDGRYPYDFLDSTEKQKMVLNILAAIRIGTHL